MYAVKKGYEGGKVCVSDKKLIEQGLSDIIILDTASQTQLEYLFKKEHPSVEKIEKNKGVK
jgi:hypothetical protein